MSEALSTIAADPFTAFYSALATWAFLVAALSR